MFFTAQQQQVADRQRQLLARSARLRGQLAREARVLHRPLALADQLRHGWQWLRAHPELPIGAGLLLVVLRPRRAWRLARRAWLGWQLWRRWQRWQADWLGPTGALSAPPPGNQRPPRR